MLDCWGGSWIDGAVSLRSMAGSARDSNFSVGCAADGGAGMGGAIDFACHGFPMCSSLVVSGLGLEGVKNGGVVSRQAPGLIFQTSLRICLCGRSIGLTTRGLSRAG